MGLLNNLFSKVNQNSINIKSNIRRLTPSERQEIVDLHQDQGYTATEIAKEMRLDIEDVVRAINAKQKQLEKDKKNQVQTPTDNFQTEILDEIKLLKAKQELSLMQQDMEISKQKADLDHQRAMLDIQKQKAELQSEGYDIKDDLTEQVLDRLGSAFLQKAENHILNSPRVEKSKEKTTQTNLKTEDTTTKIDSSTPVQDAIVFDPLLEWDEKTLYSFLDQRTDQELDYLFKLDYKKFCDTLKSKVPGQKINIKNLERGYAIIHDGVYLTNEQ